MRDLRVRVGETVVAAADAARGVETVVLPLPGKCDGGSGEDDMAEIGLDRRDLKGRTEMRAFEAGGGGREVAPGLPALGRQAAREEAAMRAGFGGLGMAGVTTRRIGNKRRTGRFPRIRRLRSSWAGRSSPKRLGYPASPNPRYSSAPPFRCLLWGSDDAPRAPLRLSSVGFRAQHSSLPSERGRNSCAPASVFVCAGEVAAGTAASHGGHNCKCAPQLADGSEHAWKVPGYAPPMSKKETLAL
ncbi:hypothetical protein Taro_025243 [Colocasia esculenta]|uniref:Uncharacterized protein n=1 Tax=Colocasia esculenta TaxID=4460 RepID=A0A843VMS5_COLES|nr:hypothetical protein [Colocasia esculenta]